VLALSVPVLLGVMFRRLVVMVLRVKMVTVCRMCVVSGLFMIAGFMMLRRLFVVMRRVLMVFCGVPMMLGCVGICHGQTSNLR
jgi:hypothetical protein